MRLSKRMKRILATLLTVAILGEQVSVISWAQELSIESETAAIQEIEESTEETVTENEVEIVTEEECEVETEIETEVEAESETETEVEVLEEVTEPDTKQEYIYSDENVTVKATLQYADAIPDEAEFRVTAVTSSTEGYNYDAYMDALNEHSEDISASSSMDGVDRNAEYTEDNTLLYDIAFMVDKVDEDGNIIPGEKVEYQPAEGSVTFSFTFASKQLENEIEAECDEAITVVHLPLEESIKQSVDSTEQATDISAENVEIEIVDAVVSLNRTADEVEFCLEDLSLVAFVGVTGQELNPGTARNYQSILGNAVYYGILSNQINKTGHMDTNFATKYLTGSGNVTAGAYTGDNAGDFIIAHKDDQSFSIDGKAVNVWCTEAISNTITITNNSSKLFTTKAALEAYIDDMMDHVIDQSIAMANEHTYVVERVPDQNNADIDLTGRPDGTYYISLIELLNNSQNGAIKIKKRSTQTVVFNYTGTTEIALKRFSVWNVDVENGYQSSATSNGAIDVTARTIVFNMPNVTSFRNEGGICGIVIAPRATYDIGSTSSGWLVTNVMASSGGEWHNVWGEMPIHSEIPAPIELSAMKYVDGREPVGDTEIFTFVLEKGVQDSQGNWTWTTLETVQNKGSVIKFSKINFENEGDYYYRISESPAQNGGYRYDAHKYIAKVSVAKTNSISGSTTRCYVDDVNYYLANEVSEISTSNVAQNVIFHNYKVDTISIQVKKTWRDSVDNDGKRPESVTVELLAHKTVKAEAVLNATNHWSYQWDNLPTSENNQIIDYTVREKNVPNGYTSTVVGTMENGFEVINSHSKEKITVSGTKEWNDQNNRDGIRPEKITVNLYADGVYVRSQDITPNANGQWNYSFEYLDKYKAGKEIVYTVAEEKVEGYTTQIQGHNITNSHEIEKMDVSVEKVWFDQDNKANHRPTSIQVQLYADGNVYGSPVTLNDNNAWRYVWNNLPVYKAGEKGVRIHYTVDELNVSEAYTKIVTGGVTNGFVITNVHDVDLTKISVNKVWADNNNNDGIRPREILVQLYADEVESGQPQRLNAANGWSYSWEVYEKDKNGKNIHYTVKELNVPEGYTSVITGSETDGYTITNSHTPEKTQINATKVWMDDNNLYQMRPTSIRLQLYADGELYEDPVTVTANSEDTSSPWTYQWVNLPKYSKGKEIQYTVKEMDIPYQYTSSIDGDMVNGYVITNAYKRETVELSVKKVWNDNENQDGIRPTKVFARLHTTSPNQMTLATVELDSKNNWSYTWTGLPKYYQNTEVQYTITEVFESAAVQEEYTSVVSKEENVFVITNSHVPKTTEVSVSKIWNDGNNQDGLRSTNVKVNLLADGNPTGQSVLLNADNQWSHVWENLPEREQGKEIVYTVQEESIPTGYISTVSGNASNGYVITNFHKVETFDLPVTKVWYDNNDQDGIRPDFIDVQLLANREPYGSKVTLNEINNWNYIWNNLPKYFNGNLIEYSIEELEGPEKYTSVITGGTENGFIITNSYETEVTEISVRKAWEDENNTDQLRPKSVKVQLYGDEEPVGNPIILDEVNNWTYRWEELAKNDAGKKISYTVKEMEVPYGYTASVTGNATGGFVITNRHQVEKTEVSVKKVWEDKNNIHNKRPGSIQVQLYADGEAEGAPVTLSGSNGWSYKWNNLPKNKARRNIQYTVAEVNVPEGYSCVVSGGMVNGYVITNICDHLEMIEIPVKKVWYDNNSNKRPSSIKVELLANGVSCGSPITLDANNQWSHKWENMPRFAAGTMINYSVREINIPNGYACAVTGGTENGFVVTNYIDATQIVNIPVSKVWVDDNNRDGIRPKYVKVQLYGDRKAIGEPVILDERNGWTYTWEELKYSTGGTEIVYDVKEEPVAGYTTSITKNSTGEYVITNSHEIETINIPVKKVWFDKDDTHKIRPTSIKVQLYANGVEFGSEIELNGASSNPWSYTWTNLKKNEAGKPIVYTIKEVTVPTGYTSVVTGGTENGFTITNTCDHLEMIEIPVKKVWDDGNNQDGLRPESIQVQLYADGDPEGSPVILNEKNQWSYKWEKLEKNANGTLVVYTVKEVGVPAGYKYVVTGNNIDGYVITNRHKPETVNIPVKKVWFDKDDIHNSRPEYIEVQLYANGKASGTPVVLNADNQWSYTWNDMARFSNGKMIAYSVKESRVPSGYTSVVTGGTENGFIITNNCNHLEMTEIKVSKKWMDFNNQDGIRPEFVKVQLYGDDEAIGESIILDERNQWTYTWEELKFSDEHKEIKYTVKEEPVAGYQSTITGTAAEGYVITNSHEVETVNIPVKKVWYDGNTQGNRPQSVTVELYADGVKVESEVVLNNGNNWSHLWSNLPKNKAGKPIVYTIKEINVPAGYTSVISGGVQNGFIVTNTLDESEIIEISVHKIWDDANNREGMRPKEIQVQLYADGVEEGAPIVLSDSNQWSYKWELLKKKSNGDLMEYTVKEVNVPNGYLSKVEGEMDSGYTITNHISEVDIQKIDKTNGKGLEGATLQVIDQDGQIVHEWTSTKYTKLIRGLLIGKEYILREKASPQGYHSTDDILFMIDENGNIITEAGNLSQEGVLLIKNEKIIIPSDSDDEPDESEEPEDTEETEEIQENRIAVETGDSANIVATCLAFIGSLLGLILITFEKKKKKS